MREIRQGQFYRHFKGNLYQIVAVAEHTETKECMVVYQALYGDYRVYVRPYEMFVSEVDHKKYPQVTQKYRFELTEFVKESEEKEDKQTNVLDVQVEEPVLQKKVQKPEKSEDAKINPLLLEFLDADTLEEKLHVMIFGRNQMDDNLLNSIAISLDLVVDEKSTQEKYDEILNCLSMMKRFEKWQRENVAAQAVQRRAVRGVQVSSRLKAFWWSKINFPTLNMLLVWSVEKAVLESRW